MLVATWIRLVAIAEVPDELVEQGEEAVTSYVADNAKYLPVEGGSHYGNDIPDDWPKWYADTPHYLAWN